MTFGQKRGVGAGREDLSRSKADRLPYSAITRMLVAPNIC